MIIASVKKAMEILPTIRGTEYTLDESLACWVGSMSDYQDSVLVSSSLHVGIRQIITDDCDLATHTGITMYTLNKAAVDAARSAKRLVTL